MSKPCPECGKHRKAVRPECMNYSVEVVDGNGKRTLSATFEHEQDARVWARYKTNDNPPIERAIVCYLGNESASFTPFIEPESKTIKPTRPFSDKAVTKRAKPVPV